MRALKPTLLAAASTASLLGCAAKPAEPPLVLHSPERPVQHAVARERTSRPRKSETNVSSGRSARPLTPAQKESLFRDFDSYLQQSGPN